MAFKDKNIISVFLSYSPSTAPSVAVCLSPLGSKTIFPSGVLANAEVERMSLLTITPVSVNPRSFNILLSSLANTFVLPSSTASLNLITLGSTSSGGNTLLCHVVSASTNCCIVSFGSLPSLASLSPNSAGVSSKPSALLAISNSWFFLI